MDNLQQKILAIFSIFKTPVNGNLKLQNIESQIKNWDKRSQDNSQTALETLISNGYIYKDDTWLKLTQKGYDFLNQGYSIKNTEDLILNFLVKRNLSVGDIILYNWFTALFPKLERIHLDNFNDALQNIINKGFIEIRDSKMYLTQGGYDKIY